MDLIEPIMIALLLIAVGALAVVTLDLRWKQRVHASRFASVDAAIGWVAKDVAALREASGARGAAARVVPFAVEAQPLERDTTIDAAHAHSAVDDDEGTMVYTRDHVPPSGVTKLSAVAPSGGAPRPGKR
jgi:hypothetical protein